MWEMLRRDEFQLFRRRLPADFQGFELGALQQNGEDFIALAAVRDLLGRTKRRAVVLKQRDVIFLSRVVKNKALQRAAVFDRQPNHVCMQPGLRFVVRLTQLEAGGFGKIANDLPKQRFAYGV